MYHTLHSLFKSIREAIFPPGIIFLNPILTTLPLLSVQSPLLNEKKWNYSPSKREQGLCTNQNRLISLHITMCERRS